MVAGLGFEPRTFGLCVPRQLSLPPFASLCEAKRVGFVVWTIPSPCQPSGKRGCPPSSLYTFSLCFALRSKASGAWLGITSRSVPGGGFTDFDGCHPAVSVPGSPLEMSPTSYLTAPPRSRGARIVGALTAEVKTGRDNGRRAGYRRRSAGSSITYSPGLESLNVERMSPSR